MNETVEISRRAFMSGAAATALAASAGPIGTATAVPSEPSISNAETSRFDVPGNPSRKAERMWAEHEYRHYQRMQEIYEQQGGPEGGPGKPTDPNFTQTLNAVKDIGCDPTGSRPISDDLDSSHMQNGTLIVFPSGNYKITSRFSAAVDGTFGIVGKGYKQVNGAPKPGKKTTTFVAPANSRAQFNFTATTGIFANIVLDQRNNMTSIGGVFRSDGFMQVQDVRYVGWQDNTGSVPDQKEVPMCTLRGTSESATVRADRVVGRYVGKPGTKESGGAPFFWVGSANKGTAQMGHCVVSGAADNASYSSRTPGNAQVKGGKYINNIVTQSRISGRHSWVDGATLIFDADSYEGPFPEKFNDVKGTWGVEIERSDETNKPSGAVLRNLEVRALSAGAAGMGPPIGVRGSGGAVKMANCRITHKLNGPTIYAEAPGTGYSGETAPPPHNITLVDSLVIGTSENADKLVQVSGRENSLVTGTCFKAPGAGPKSIEGMQIGKNVGFGKTCEGKAGLRAPKKVGSPGKLPPVNISFPENPGTGTTPKKSWTLGNKASGAAAGGFFAAIFGGLLGGLGMVFLVSFVLPAVFVTGLIWAILGD